MGLCLGGGGGVKHFDKNLDRILLILDRRIIALSRNCFKNKSHVMK